MEKQSIIEEVEELVENPICIHVAGSQSYGTNTPESDLDIRGIFCSNRVNISTPFYPIQEQNIPSLEDAKVYEVANYLELYTKGNPNIVESLWVEEDDVLLGSGAYDLLREHASDLLSSKVAFTFTGYALSQLKRIKGHNKWINNPQPEERPVTGDYVKMIQNLTPDKIFPNTFDLRSYTEDHMLVPYGSDIYGLIEASGKQVIEKSGNIQKYPYENIPEDLKKIPPKFVVKVCMDEFRKDKENHNNYWDWKRTRNPKRHELEEKFGYDTKHAMHLVRLLRMGREILTTGEVLVKRPDAQELLDIRNGAWSYEEILKWAEAEDKLIRGELYNKTHLRKKPNIKLASKILMDVQDLYWK